MVSTNKSLYINHSFLESYYKTLKNRANILDCMYIGASKMTMKVLFPLFCLVLSINANAQKITKSNNAKETPWEVLTKMNFNDNCFYSYQKIRKVDNNYSVQLKIMIGRVFSISKDAPLIFTLDDSSKVTLRNTEFNITCAGCGEISAKSQAQGLEVTYSITKEDVDKLIEDIQAMQK